MAVVSWNCLSNDFPRMIMNRPRITTTAIPAAINAFFFMFNSLSFTLMYVSQPKIIHKPLLSSYTDTGRCYEKNKNNRSDPIGSHCSGSYELCIFLFSFALPLCHDSFCIREVVCIHKCLLRNDRPAVSGQRLKKLHPDANPSAVFILS